MMAGRYLAMTGGTAEYRCQQATAAIRKHKLDVILENPAITVFADQSLCVIRPDDRGVILGEIFLPGVDGPLAMVGPGDWEMVLATEGQYLIDRFWGGYVAILTAGAEPPVVIRSPFGWLPCLHSAQPDLIAFSSDVPLLIDSKTASGRLDRDALARHLLASDIRRSETVLGDIAELRGGDRLTINGHISSTLWSPWTFASRARQIVDAEDAHRTIRDVARNCVRERTTATGRHLLMMSGGLDSSIVAACLSDAGRDFAGFTFSTDNSTGDEREPARRVADHLGVPLMDGRCAIEDVDIRRSAAAHLPRPIARSFEQGVQALLIRAAQTSGAVAVLDGGAGDNIFCTMKSPAPIADCLLNPSGRPYFWRTVATVADLAQASIGKVAWRGWRRARSGRPYRRAPDMNFLHARLLEYADDALAHPWLHAPTGILPGKSVHVALLAPAQALVEDFDPLNALPSHAVLASQPLIEACLCVPSWLWFHGASNRATARFAFAADLPERTVWRQSKGTPDSYLIELLETHRRVIRTMLSDGVLASLDLIDTNEVVAALDDPRPVLGERFARLMHLADIEVWARGWST